MSEESYCQKCNEHYGIKVELAALRTLIDEREKQIGSEIRNQQNAINLAREQIDHRLTGMNEFQKRMDRLENTFATRPELKSIERLIYIGVGIALTAQVLIRFIQY